MHCIVGPLTLKTRGARGGPKHAVCTAFRGSAEPTSCEMVSLEVSDRDWSPVRDRGGL
jgi:hypothetical protein